MSHVSKQIEINLPAISLSLRLPVLALLLLGLLIVSLCAMSIGAYSIPLTGLLGGDLTQQQQNVLTAIRLPRVLLGIVVGAALALSGAALQGLFRNPLADPGLIGIAGGAALAVAIMIVLAGPLSGYLGLYGLTFAAFAGGIATSIVIFRIARITGTTSVTYMLLAGIAINALAAAATGFLAYLSDDQQLRTLTFWTMGSLGGALWPAVFISLSVVIPSSVILLRSARELNLLILGDDEARQLGVDSEKLKRNIIICTALTVAVAVAMSGIIGFVGLVVPHLIRLTLGPDHRLLFPASAILGAILLVVADTIARTALAPAEVPVGIFTSLVGGPFFLWLLIRQYANRFGI